MEYGGTHYRDVGDIGGSRACAVRNGAGLVGARGLRKYRDCVSSVNGNERGETEGAVLQDGQIVAAIVLQNKSGTAGVAGNRAANGNSSKRAGNLDVDRDALGSSSAAIGHGAGLRRAGWLLRNRNVIGLTEGDGVLELCGCRGASDGEEISAILQNQASTGKTGDGDANGDSARATSNLDASYVGGSSAAPAGNGTGLRRI